MYHSPATAEAQMNKNFRKVFDGKAPTTNTLLHAQNSYEGARLTFKINFGGDSSWFRFGTALSYIYNVIAEFVLRNFCDIHSISGFSIDFSLNL